MLSTNAASSPSQVSLTSLSTNQNQSRAKKLGSIMGIAKRSRSIHYTECPSNIISKRLKLSSTKQFSKPLKQIKHKAHLKNNRHIF